MLSASATYSYTTLSYIPNLQARYHATKSTQEDKKRQDDTLSASSPSSLSSAKVRARGTNPVSTNQKPEYVIPSEGLLVYKNAKNIKSTSIIFSSFMTIWGAFIISNHLNTIEMGGAAPAIFGIPPMLYAVGWYAVYAGATWAISRILRSHILEIRLLADPGGPTNRASFVKIIPLSWFGRSGTPDIIPIDKLVVPPSKSKQYQIFVDRITRFPRYTLPNDDTGIVNRDWFETALRQQRPITFI